ncbi:DUF4145 domain-containing protein [Pseudomonas frederiksbergensis]|uniref:DUF4145 domain-containing protein n=1 Tax=Pseudomonas frederiksbergensis TaxID=104087 RepID=UPI000F4751EC|nr:DUF4145 domain-containing protein [Pseudomonas frederiksbergensis]
MKEECIIKSDCRSCSRNTRHEIISKVEDRDSEYWRIKLETWSIIRCLGCHTYAFHRRFDELDRIEDEIIEDLKEESTEEDSFYYLNHVRTDIYPSVIKNHRTLTHTGSLPILIKTIYEQTLKSLTQNANVLASIGLRACIESVCNHLEISGRNLQQRIDALFKNGHVSNGEKRRLHAIRFLGNDAAHEIKEPEYHDIRVALDIIEHLLNNVFILERKAGYLNTVTENYVDFIKLLKACAHNHVPDKAFSLAELLGKQIKLIPSGPSFDQFELQLSQEVDSGVIKFLTKSSVEIGKGKKISLYEINELQLYDDEDFDFIFDDENPF